MSADGLDRKGADLAKLDLHETELLSHALVHATPKAEEGEGVLFVLLPSGGIAVRVELVRFLRISPVTRVSIVKARSLAVHYGQAKWDRTRRGRTANTCGKRWAAAGEVTTMSPLGMVNSAPDLVAIFTSCLA